jgi:hypothetical protein
MFKPGDRVKITPEALGGFRFLHPYCVSEQIVEQVESGPTGHPSMKLRGHKESWSQIYWALALPRHKKNLPEWF